MPSPIDTSFEAASVDPHAKDTQYSLPTLKTLIEEIEALRPARYAVEIASLTSKSYMSPSVTRWALSDGAKPHALSASSILAQDLAHDLGISYEEALAHTRGASTSPYVHVHLRSWTVWTNVETTPTLADTKGLGALLDTLAHTQSNYAPICAKSGVSRSLALWLSTATLVTLS